MLFAVILMDLHLSPSTHKWKDWYNCVSFSKGLFIRGELWTEVFAFLWLSLKKPKVTSSAVGLYHGCLKLDETNPTCSDIWCAYSPHRPKNLVFLVSQSLQVYRKKGSLHSNYPVAWYTVTLASKTRRCEFFPLQDRRGEMYLPFLLLGEYLSNEASYKSLPFFQWKKWPSPLCLKGGIQTLSTRKCFKAAKPSFVVISILSGMILYLEEGDFWCTSTVLFSTG